MTHVMHCFLPKVATATLTSLKIKPDRASGVRKPAAVLLRADDLGGCGHRHRRGHLEDTAAVGIVLIGLPGLSKV